MIKVSVFSVFLQFLFYCFYEVIIMRIYPALVVFLGISQNHNFDSKMWIAASLFNRTGCLSFSDNNYLKSNCFNLKMTDRL